MQSLSNNIFLELVTGSREGFTYLVEEVSGTSAPMLAKILSALPTIVASLSCKSSAKSVVDSEKKLGNIDDSSCKQITECGN